MHTEFAGRVFDPNPTQVSTVSPMHDYETNYAYLVILTAAG